MSPLDLERVLVRDYSPTDREACLVLFDSNVPDSFTLPERPDFQVFLDDLPGPYFVLEIAGDIVACGGYARAEGTTCADLCWGMVRHDAQGSGLGRLLTQAGWSASVRTRPSRKSHCGRVT